jgi:hypothetical protein
MPGSCLYQTLNDSLKMLYNLSCTIHPTISSYVFSTEMLDHEIFIIMYINDHKLNNYKYTLSSYEHPAHIVHIQYNPDLMFPPLVKSRI